MNAHRTSTRISHDALRAERGVKNPLKSTRMACQGAGHTTPSRKKPVEMEPVREYPPQNCSEAVPHMAPSYGSPLIRHPRRRPPGEVISFPEKTRWLPERCAIAILDRSRRCVFVLPMLAAGNP